MKKLSLLFIVLVGSMCVFQSCNKDDDDDYTMGNQEFLIRASSSNRLEIRAGEMSETKGESAAIKTYGQHMISEHSAAETELLALASAKGIAIPEPLLTSHQINLNILNEIAPNQFDEVFTELMVLTHEEAVDLFHQASQPNGVPDPELRSWAASKLPALQMHLEEAQELYLQVHPKQ